MMRTLHSEMIPSFRSCTSVGAPFPAAVLVVEIQGQQNLGPQQLDLFLHGSVEKKPMVDPKIVILVQNNGHLLVIISCQ